MDANLREILDNLSKHIREKKPVDWDHQKLDDAFQFGSFVDASANSITTKSGDDGSMEVCFDEGLTPKHYKLILPYLARDPESENMDKASLALGVIENMLCKAGFNITVLGWLELKRVLEAERGNFDEWLPQSIDREGFDTVVNEIGKRWKAYWVNRPPTSCKLVVLSYPTWISTSRILSYGPYTWSFRRVDGPLKELLDEFQRLDWPPAVAPKFLKPDQVAGVARVLRRATQKIIKWKASEDGVLSWQLI